MLISVAGKFFHRSRLRRRAGVAIAIAAIPVLLGSISAVAAPSGTGSISGHVVDSLGNPLSGICVGVEAGPEVQSDGSGAYSVTGLSTGVYKLRFRDCNPTAQYVTQWYLGHAESSGADQLPVTDGADLSLADVTIERGASVSGTVTDTHGAPLGNICADANVQSGNNYNWIGGAVTAPDGTYTIGLLPATDVRIHFRDCSSSNYLDQWYDGQTGPDSSQPIVLSTGADRPGVNAQLAQGVVVAGRVTDAQGNPISGINVNVNPTENGSSAWGQTGSDGRYTTSALPAGTYRVQFQDSSSNAKWASQYWNGKQTRNVATVLTIATGSGPVRSGVNATLTAGASISGTVTAPNGAPAADMCATAIVDTPDGPDWLASTNTASDGRYTLTGLPGDHGRRLLPGLQRPRSVRRPVLAELDQLRRGHAADAPGRGASLRRGHADGAGGRDHRHGHRPRRTPALRHLRAGIDRLVLRRPGAHAVRRHLRDPRSHDRARTRCSSWTATTRPTTRTSGGTTDRPRRPPAP